MVEGAWSGLNAVAKTEMANCIRIFNQKFFWIYKSREGILSQLDSCRDSDSSNTAKWSKKRMFSEKICHLF